MQLVTTADGSKTLYHEQVGEHYHSKNGAYQESKHVFLYSGLEYFLAMHDGRTNVRILEVGFGTGLNFLLTSDFAHQHGVELQYCGIEAFPLPLSIIGDTGYEKYVQTELWNAFLSGYESSQKEYVQILPNVQIHVAHQKVLDFVRDEKFDVIYFDAFAAAYQPEMWTHEVLAHVLDFLRPGGVFVTYAITGNLKRSMKALGFSIEKAPGAPGKREMLRAIKRDQA